jgi:hypothetical protein
VRFVRAEGLRERHGAVRLDGHLEAFCVKRSFAQNRQVVESCPPENKTSAASERLLCDSESVILTHHVTRVTHCAV